MNEKILKMRRLPKGKYYECDHNNSCTTCSSDGAVIADGFDFFEFTTTKGYNDFDSLCESCFDDLTIAIPEKHANCIIEL